MSPHLLISGGFGGCPNYVSAVSAGGGIPHPVYCPDTPVEELLQSDGLVLAGGGDVMPHYYGQRFHGSRELNPRRDEFELALTAAFLRAEKPILAICRGFQLINVALGGDLVQAMKEPFLSWHTRREGRDSLHPTTISPHSFLGTLYGTSAVVNSAHHQAVNRLGEGLTGCQWSEDGIVEGFYHTSLPVFGVQWHPERTGLVPHQGDVADGGALFRFFVAQCQ